MELQNLNLRTFKIAGALSAPQPAAVRPLVKCEFPGAAVPPSRPMSGWLMTYGQLANGRLTPTVDRDDQIADVARELGLVDWAPYVDGGVWNDTHNDEPHDRFGQVVGYPLGLQFHDETSPLAKSHGKVGFYTWGYLLDRDQPENWRDYKPSPRDLARSDHFWDLAKALAPTGRSLGLSAQGVCALSPCNKRILWAQVAKASLCELPKNPDATIEIGSVDSPLAWLKKGMASDPSPCGRCRCPPGICAGAPAPLAKAADAAPGALTESEPPKIPAELERLARAAGLSPYLLRSLIPKMVAAYKISEADAARYLIEHIRRRSAAKLEARHG